jgi:hypothetical protein
MTISRNLSFLAEGVSSTGVLGATYGGTGQSSITTGDLLYGSASNTISKLAIGSTGTVLRVVGGVPSWGTDYTGTVTSVAALTLGTTGTDLSSTVANGTTTPVITLNVPTASATNRGVLSSADWTTFNNKGSGSVTSVAATVPTFLSISGSPITTSGTLAITYSGTALPVANGGTGLVSLTAGYIPYGNGTSAFSSSSGLQYTSNTLTTTNDASISGLTVGKGGGSVATNTVLGNGALATNTSGNTSVALGYYALNANSTGSNNVAIGRNSAQNTLSDGNTAVGDLSLTTNSSGTANVSIGRQTLFNATSASNNTVIGYQAGYYITTGAKNSILGNYNGNQGGLDIRTSSNYIVLSDGDGNPRIITFPTGGVSIGNTTDPGAGALSVSGSNGVLSTQFYQTSTSAYGFTLSTLAPAFNFDAATCAITVTSGNSISFSSSFSGVIMVTDAGYSGCTAVLICGGGGTLVLGNSTTTQYFTNSSLTGDYRFYNTGGAYQLFASARTTTFKIISFRTQNTT